MTTTKKQWGRDLFTPDELMDALEGIRAEFKKTLKPRTKDTTIEAIASRKRKAHQGGDGNHRFEGERYIATKDKEVRRFQLRKLIDEGGQDTVGGPVASHPTLSRWHSEAFGVSPGEIDSLEKMDWDPEELVSNGWYYWMHRSEDWPVLLATALVGEGEKRLPEVREQMVIDLKETRELYEELGIEDIDRAMMNQHEHSPIGADADHVVFGEDVTRAWVNTPEKQERLRQAFILRLHRRG
jgi:hypothetical protein